MGVEALVSMTMAELRGGKTTPAIADMTAFRHPVPSMLPTKIFELHILKANYMNLKSDSTPISPRGDPRGFMRRYAKDFPVGLGDI